MNRREFSSLMIGGVVGTALPRWSQWSGAAPLRVNGERLNGHITELSRFGRNTQGGVSRVAYSDADKQGRAYVMDLMRQAKLEPTIDYAANIIGRRAGSNPALKPIVFGSHVDSVPEGGNFDGPVGTLGAIEAAQTMAEQGIVTRHPIEVVAWSNEEGGLAGSRGWIGELTPADLQQIARSGKTIGDGIAFLGGDPAKIAQVRRRPGDIAGYLELHIEQGGVLAREHVDIGIVEGIVGIRWWDVTVTGFANHAGTTPMNERHDALLAAAKFVQAVNHVITSEPGRQVGTVGRIQASPGAPNVIPGQVVMSLEIRDLDAGKIVRLYERMAAEAKRIGAASGTTFDFTPVTTQTPAPSDPRVRAMIASAAAALRLSTKVMPSGAGHDAQDMARLGPMGMIFVPSQGGISHAPREFSTAGDVVNGANVLLNGVVAMDESL